MSPRVRPSPCASRRGARPRRRVDRGRSGARTRERGDARRGLALAKRDEPVGGEVAEALPRAVRPADLDGLDPLPGAEPEVEPRVVRGEVAPRAAALADLEAAACPEGHAGADGVLVLPASLEAEERPVVPAPRLVQEEERRAAGGDDHQ